MTVLAVYAAFWGLLVVDVAAALFAGPAFVTGRIGAHLWLYVTRP